MNVTNQVQLIGNFGAAPELVITTNENKVCSFGFATHRRIENAAGKMESVTDWHDCVSFGKTAQLIADYMKKGSRALLSGRLSKRTYVNKEGVTIYVTEVIINGIHFLDSKDDSK